MSERLYPEYVEKDLQQGFILTDPDSSYQRFKMIDKTTFLYRDDRDDGSVYEEEVDILQISEDEKANAVQAFYTSIQGLQEICDDNTDCVNQMIAECVFEYRFLCAEAK